MNDLRADVRRLLRILDGDNGTPSLPVRLDRLEATAQRNATKVSEIDRYIDPDNPLFDAEIARRVIEHVERSDGMSLMQRRVFGFFVRELVSLSLQVATVVALGYLAMHGVPVAPH